MVKVYKLYGSGVATASAVSNIQMARAGRILSVLWSIKGTAGAGTTLMGEWELSVNSLSTIGTHDTPGTSLSGIAYSCQIASAGYAANSVSAVGIDIAAGDKLYLHANVGGTAPSINVVQCYVSVQH